MKLLLMKLFFIALTSLMASIPSFAQGWPTHSLRIVVPFSPGGMTDIAGRAIAKGLEGELKQPVVVENRPGAGGNIGAELVAHSAADGYSLLLTTQLLTYNKAAYRKIRYDLEKDFDPIGEVGYSAAVICVNPKLGVNTLSELISLMKSKPKGVSVATAGSGLTTPYFLSEAKVDALLVQYKGLAPALYDLIGGVVDVWIGSTDTAGPFIANGQVKALAITTSVERSRFFPNIPTVAETIPDFSDPGFFGISVPAGTPAAVRQRLSAALQAVRANPDFKARMEKLTVEISPDGSSAAFRERIAKEVQRAQKFVKMNNAYIN